MTIQWEIILLLVSIPVYLVGIAGMILAYAPISFRPLAHANTGGGTSSGVDFRNKIPAYGIMLTGFGLHTLMLFIRGVRAGHFPVTSIFESLIFFSWIIIAITILMGFTKKIPMINLGGVPIALVLMMLAFTKVQDVEPLMPALQSYWLSIHAGFAFMSYAVYTLACVTGIFYLFLDRQMKKKQFGLIYQMLPSLDVLDELNYLGVATGFVFLTIAIVTGSIWANETWGRYWNWDPKETWSLITWLLYAILLHVRITSKIRGRKIAYLSILGFGFVIFTYLGVGLMFSGLHSYLVK